MRVVLLTANLPPRRCGVGDYTVALGETLAARGDEVVLVTGRDQAPAPTPPGFSVRNTLPGWGPGAMPQLWREVRAVRPDVVVLQWVPFLYSRTGTNLTLPLTLALLAATGTRLQVMVHEPWVRFIWWSYFLTGPLQRLALGILVLASERVHVSIGFWRDMLRRRFPWRRDRIDWVPVGSNIPVAGPRPGPTARERAGIPADVLVVGVFSLSGAAKAFSLTVAAWRAVAVRLPTARLVLVGATAEEAGRVVPELAADPRCLVTGPLAASDVSHWMEGLDVLIAPFLDGITTRRTSVMAATAHGVPVVTTQGPLTDALFLDGPLRLSAIDEAAFAGAVMALATDAALRARLGPATRAFHERHFAWPAIAERLLPRAASGQSPDALASSVGLTS